MSSTSLHAFLSYQKPVRATEFELVHKWLHENAKFKRSSIVISQVDEVESKYSARVVRITEDNMACIQFQWTSYGVCSMLIRPSPRIHAEYQRCAYCQIVAADSRMNARGVLETAQARLPPSNPYSAPLSKTVYAVSTFIRFQSKGL